MRSSGLIYAVIVGAWAAYLVPMWLRRQDELNEARPTERFSTAIRLLAGRSAMERRATRVLGDDETSPESDSAPVADADPRAVAPAAPAASASEPVAPASVAAAAAAAARGSVERRARLLARRRRMVTTLFLAFAAGAVVAAVFGVAFLWVPAVPGLLLTLYIGHLRRLERQRYEVKIDRTRAARDAERLRDRERTRAAAPRPADRPRQAERPRPTERQQSARPPAAAPSSAPAPAPADGRPHLRLATTDSALVEATDHEEWVDGMRERAAAGPDSWEPVPVPLPTYVTAPVAPRSTRGLDPRSTWDAGRTTEARNTPLFDQYAEPTPGTDADYPSRPRAANE
ncbi:divisome protein SepX/GlpR [Kitasatospora sp. P5_F3]